MIAFAPVILPIIFAAAGDPANLVAFASAFGVVAAAIIGVIGGVIHLRTRKPADARDDRSSEMATAKSAAEVAMELVDTTKSWALDLIGLLRTENTNLLAKNQQLETELSEVRAEIRALRASGLDHAGELTLAREREKRLIAERDSALASLARLQRALDEAQERGIEELTLSPAAVKKRREEMEGNQS